MLQWLFTATGVIVNSSLNIEEHKSQLSHIVSFLRREDIPQHNRDLYSQILRGTQISNALDTDGMFAQSDSSNSEILPSSICSPTSVIPFCPVLVTLCLNSFVLIHASQLNPGDWGRIKANYVYRLAEPRFAQMYSICAGGVFQILCSLVDTFKQDILSAVLSMEQPTELQEVITELLDYSST